MPSFLSVIIPFFNDWDKLNLCVNALLNQTFSADRFEIIVINNASSPMISPNFLYLEHVKLLHEPKPGSYSARNTGVLGASGDILCFTDADCIPHKDWLANASKWFEDPKVERVGGKVEIFFENALNKTLAELYEHIFAFNQQRNVEQNRVSITANFFARRTLFDKVGLFNSDRFSGEDFGWNRRANKLEIDMIYASDVIVGHPARASLKELAEKKRRVYGGMKIFDTKVKSRVFYYLLTYIVVNIMLQFVYPCGKVLLGRQYTFVEKIKTCWVIFYLYLHIQHEHFRLVFGGIPRR